MVAKKVEQPRRSATEKEDSENSGTMDLRQFAFYAFAGRTGHLHWSRENENVEVQSSDAPYLIPYHNYKIDVHALNTRHPGQFECREIRESILRVMPYHWDRREDTSFELAHFRRHKMNALKKINGKATTYPYHMPEENHPPGKDETKRISNVIGKAVNYAKGAKTKNPSPYIPTITNYTLFWWVPNVGVAHQKEGIEAVHLATGRTICRNFDRDNALKLDKIGGSWKRVRGCTNYVIEVVLTPGRASTISFQQVW